MSKVSSLVTAAEAQEILNKHNCPRQRYTLKPLVWNWELAAHAQEHADRCIWDHASHIGLGVPGEGENLSLAMNRPVGVDGWLAEERNYDCPNAQCAQSTVCGHWTQMAWASTGQVGCGKRRCASLQKAPGFLNSDILVCRYSPPGNYVGQHMASGSQCASGASTLNCSGAGGTTIASQPAAPSPVSAPVAAPAPQKPAPTAPSTPAPAPALRQTGVATGGTDKFTAEQQRVANLQAASATTAEYAPNVTTTRFATRDPLPYTLPVYEDSNEEGYPTAEEATQAKSDFARNIIIAISVTLVVMIAIVAVVSYRYRDNISKVWNRVIKSNADATVAKSDFLKSIVSLKV